MVYYDGMQRGVGGGISGTLATDCGRRGERRRTHETVRRASITVGGIKVRSGRVMPSAPWWRQLQVLPAIDARERHLQRSFCGSASAPRSAAGSPWQRGLLAALAVASCPSCALCPWPVTQWQPISLSSAAAATFGPSAKLSASDRISSLLSARTFEPHRLPKTSERVSYRSIFDLNPTESLEALDLEDYLPPWQPQPDAPAAGAVAALESASPTGVGGTIPLHLAQPPWL